LYIYESSEEMGHHMRNSESHVASARDELWCISFLIFILIMQAIRLYSNTWKFYIMCFRSVVVNIMCSVTQFLYPTCFMKFYNLHLIVVNDDGKV
jgi:hypothetical protein